MATKVVFGNKLIQEPGAQSRILSGIKNASQTSSSGNVLILDSGNGALFGGGSGINGTLSKGKDAIYSFDNPEDLRNHLKGGIYYSLANLLFFPNGNGIPGVPIVHVVSARTSSPATITFTFASGGQIVLQPQSEGFGANGVLGNEVPAVGKITITGVGSTGSTISARVDGISIGDYITVVGDTTTDIASKTAAEINLAQGPMGYRATSIGNIITILPPYNLGAAGNAKVLTTTVTGVTTTVITFVGGVNGSKLTRGYGAELQVGTMDPTKFRIALSRGQFTGLAPDGIPWNEINEVDSETLLLARSKEFTNTSDFLLWAQNDFSFNNNFVIVSVVPGNVVTGDLTTYAAMNLAVGGTETYNTGDLNTALDSIGDLDFTFILMNDYDTTATSANNVRVQSWLNNESRFDRFGIVGARANQANFNNGSSSSIAVARFYNDEKIIVVHGGPRLFSRVTGNGYREQSALHKAALVLGRLTGIAPQVPLTFKAISIVGEVHDMIEKERIIALDNGLLHTKYDSDVKAFCINEGINSLQKNTDLVNTDGSSFEIQIERIKAQLNKEIIIGARVELLSQENGPNLNTLSPVDVKQWLDGFLTRKTATTTADNLIIRFQNITVVQQQDTYKITYGFVPNGPVNKLLFTGFILDANLSA